MGDGLLIIEALKRAGKGSKSDPKAERKQILEEFLEAIEEKDCDALWDAFCALSHMHSDSESDSDYD